MVLPVLALVTAALPELVVLPLEPAGVKAPEAVEVWKSVAREFSRAGSQLNTSSKIQRTQHDFLVGPTQELVLDCGMNPKCLREIGSTLGADVVVAGAVSADRVKLLAIEVRRTQVLGRASAATGKGANKGRAAARALIGALKRKLNPDPEEESAGSIASASPAEGSAPEDATPAATVAAVALPGSESGLAHGSETAVPATTTEEEGVAEQDPSTEVENEPKAEGPDPSSEGSRTSAMETSAAAESPADHAINAGFVAIAAADLRGVASVKIDGEAIPFGGDGSIRWQGSAGSHSIVAEHVDGRRLTKEVIVEPTETRAVAFDFAPPSPAVSTAPAMATTTAPDPEPVTGQWWFWTGLGAAVAVGTVAAVVLAGGGKGGPLLPSEYGTIRGRY